MYEVDLPWLRSTFHGFEVTVDDDYDEVCLLKTTCQRNNLVG